jgi:hypothetical protein
MPSRRGHFLLLAQKKVTKEKGRWSLIREGLPAQESDQIRSAPESSPALRSVRDSKEPQPRLCQLLRLATYRCGARALEDAKTVSGWAWLDGEGFSYAAPCQGLPSFLTSPFLRAHLSLALQRNYQVFLFLFVLCGTKYRFGTIV